MFLTRTPQPGGVFFFGVSVRYTWGLENQQPSEAMNMTNEVHRDLFGDVIGAKCPACMQVMPIDEFRHLEVVEPQGWARCCRWCVKLALSRSKRLRDKYRLSHYTYLEMQIAQEGVCAICRTGPARKLHVDHCHKRRTVRSLLCGRCNKALGLFDDCPERLRAAADYLERHRNGTTRAVRPSG